MGEGNGMQVEATVAGTKEKVEGGKSLEAYIRLSYELHKLELRAEKLRDEADVHWPRLSEFDRTQVRRFGGMLEGDTKGALRTGKAFALAWQFSLFQGLELQQIAMEFRAQSNGMAEGWDEGKKREVAEMLRMRLAFWEPSLPRYKAVDDAVKTLVESVLEERA